MTLHDPGTILVTGGTGQLGRPTVAALSEAGHDIRVLSRKAGDGRVVGDLRTGSGIEDAVAGVSTVLHLATNNRKDAPQTRNLLEACSTAGVRHFVYISIVGVDDIPYVLYKDKVVCERLVSESGVDFTLLRATQFHSFVGGFFALQRRLPVQLVMDIPVQPIAIETVATRLAELAQQPAAGRAPDLGGPEHLTVRECGTLWQRARGTHRPQWALRLPGRTFAGYRAGHHLTPLPQRPGETFGEYAQRRAREDAGHGPNPRES